jgi:hypothetical protein
LFGVWTPQSRGHNFISVVPRGWPPSGPASTVFERQSRLGPLCVSCPLPDSVWPFGCHKAAY